MGENLTKAIEIDLGLPDEGVDLAGFYPPRMWDGSGCGLKASLLVSDLTDGQKLVFGSIDALFIDGQFHDALANRLGKKYHLNIIASHTHNAPALAKSLPKLGKLSAAWFDKVVARIAAGIIDERAVKLAQIGGGSIATDLVINRRLDAWQLDYRRLKKGRLRLVRTVALAPNPNGEVDNEIKAIFFKCAMGKVRAIVWSLSAHPAFAPEHASISPDFPGVVGGLLKKAYGDDLISIFLPGFAGSSIPKCPALKLGRQSFMQALISLAPFNKSIPVFDPNSYWLWSRNAANFIKDIVSVSVWEELHDLQLHHERGQPFTVFRDQSLGDIALSITAISFGSHAAIITMNGELLSEWSALLDVSSHRDGLCIVSGYGVGDCLYVPSESEIARGGYEVERFQEFFGLSGRFIENIDTKIRKNLKLVIKKLC
ncbi:hypothetical protein [Candidatus Ponderosibacter sp. Uisw_141_02]|uniref:hypothetical protein n=1 Tax=Candidatus Ponderosibacter sp. Uisw_141_02 TaxID=3231000 RepID=UPI003D413095